MENRFFFWKNRPLGKIQAVSFTYILALTLIANAEVANHEVSDISEEHASAAWIYGIKNGIHADIVEIKARRSLMGKISALGRTDDSAIARILVAEKVFQALAISRPSEREVAIASEAWLAGLSLGTQVTLEECYPLVALRLLYGRRENQERVRQILGAKAQQVPNSSGPERNQVVHAREFDGFQTTELQLALDPDVCLAWNSPRSECVLKVAQYNKSALTFSSPRSFGLDSARFKLLDKTLNVIYYSQEARRAGLAEVPEIRQLAANRMKSVALDKATMPEIDSSVLQNLYRQWFDSLFARREELELEILGSSDSAAIDSLYRLSKAIGRKRGALAAQTSSAAGIPWRSIGIDKLPEILAVSTDTLSPGGMTNVLRTPFGFFILRLAAMRHRPERSFEESRPFLYEMMRKGMKADREAELEKRAQAMYQAFPRHYITPDTLLLKLWIFPVLPKLSTVKKPPTSSDYGKPFLISSTDLPFCLLGILDHLWRNPLEDRNLSLHPSNFLETPFGVVAIQLTKRQKRG